MTASSMHPAPKSIAALLSCALLAACGGSGGGGDGGGINVPPPESGQFIRLSNTSSTGETPLGFIAINVANATSSGYAGMLDHDGDIITDGLLVGTINDARTLVTLSDGRTAELSNPAGTHHARVFRTSGFDDDRFGVVGQLASLAQVPTLGTSSYNGTVIMDAFNGNDNFALSGNALITIGWGDANDVDTVFSSLSGTKNDTQSVTNIGTVTINNATLNGTGFVGGQFSTTGTDLAYSGGGSGAINGQFFGPDATEVGGVYSLNSSGELELSGVFIAAGGLN